MSAIGFIYDTCTEKSFSLEDPTFPEGEACKSLCGDGTNDVYIIGVTKNIGPIENVMTEIAAHAGERQLFTYWRDRRGVEHNDLSLAKRDIDRIKARRLMRKYGQHAALVLRPDGTFDFLLVEDRVSKDKPGNMDEIIKLDWGKYWPGCVRKKGMSIHSILAVQRWAMSIAKLPMEVQHKIRDAENEEILLNGGTIFTAIKDVKGQYNLQAGEKLLRTHWRDKNGVDHYDTAVTTSDPMKVKELMRKHHQQSSFSILPDGRIEFVTADEDSEGNSSLASKKIDEIIELDFGKYWGCTNKKLSIRSIIDLQRWGVKIEKLPKWVQDKIEEAKKEEANLKEEAEAYLQGRYGHEETDEHGRKYVSLFGHRSGSEVTAPREVKKIFALSEGEEENYISMGTAEGEFFAHCVYLALKYSSMFFDRVCGYKIVTPENPERKIAVSFFASSTD